MKPAVSSGSAAGVWLQQSPQTSCPIWQPNPPTALHAMQLGEHLTIWMHDYVHVLGTF